MNKSNPHEESDSMGKLFCLLVLVILAYSNSFNAAWHLDDATNILHNTNVHVSSLSSEDWIMAMHKPYTPNPAIYRPIAMLTFAANWFVGGRDAVGYHIVNIALHCAVATLLYFTILHLLGTPQIGSRCRNRRHFIALLTVALWALHPIQTQAVTYIVQRMTILATLFYLSAVFCFVKARSARAQGKKSLLFGLCLVSFMLAMGSKQNTVTLPITLLLIEIIFWDGPQLSKRNRAKWIGGGAFTGIACLLLLMVFIYFQNPMSFIADGYQDRPFTLIERLLTEARVMFFYLGQLFYPVQTQFSIAHDIVLSTSWFSPWTTVVALVMIMTIIVAAAYCRRSIPLWSFAILFFFLGHSVESTILPLELVFDHRNYLPSLFLFLPFAAGLSTLMGMYRKKNRLLYGLLFGFILVLITGLGLGTYTRNMVWATEKSLWRDAMQKAPGLARPHQSLALALEGENRLDEALKLYQAALDLDDPKPALSRFISLGNIGNIYKKQKKYDLAVKNLSAAVDAASGPYVHKAQYNLALCLLNVGGEEEAAKHLNILLSRYNNNSQFLATKAYLLFQQGDIEGAERLLEQALNLNPSAKNALVTMAMVQSDKGNFKRAEHLLLTAEKGHKDNFVISLSRLQNTLRMHDTDSADHYLETIIGRFKPGDIRQYLDERASGHRYIDEIMVSVDDCMVIPPLLEHLRTQAGRLDRFSGTDK